MIFFLELLFACCTSLYLSKEFSGSVSNLAAMKVFLFRCARGEIREEEPAVVWSSRGEEDHFFHRRSEHAGESSEGAGEYSLRSVCFEEEYGAQPPIELLRQTIDQKGFYDLAKLTLNNVEDIVFIAACAPPGGGRNDVRYISRTPRTS